METLIRNKTGKCRVCGRSAKLFVHQNCNTKHEKPKSNPLSKRLVDQLVAINNESSIPSDKW